MFFDNTIISFDLPNFWLKIYLILYPSLRKLLAHTAILVAPYFLVVIEEAFLLQMTFYYYWALLGPQIFWAIRRSCGLHADSVCLIFLTHLFVCISKTVFFLHQDPLFYKYENIKPGEVYSKLFSSEVKERYRISLNKVRGH